jgi:hypothetical protein
MTKWFEITAQATKVFVVEVEDGADAKDKAVEFVRGELFGMDVSIVDRDVQELVTERELMQAKALADEICGL